ncbi:hypothetical protein WJ976_12985 [Achromobacter denitrificans]
MTENNSTPPGLTDDQIEGLAKKHIAPHADRLDAIMANPVPYQQTEQFRRVKALIVDVLSKLRAPVADERCKRCGGPGWYTSRTTGYPESIPCSACNPQGVSVERLAKDPFLAAQLWRKPVDFADAYQGAREDLAIWKRRALEAERDLRAERETSSRLVAELNAQNGPTHKGEPAPQASEAVAYLGDNVAARLDNMADNQPPGSQAQSDLYAAATIWRKHIAHRAAPQASEAVRDVEDAERWRWATAIDENVQTLRSIVLCHGGDQQKINARADFYRAALSAQPSPQTEAPHDDQWTPEQLAAIKSQGPAEPCNISLVPFIYPVPDEIADPCPQCVSGAVCKKPTCGRLIAQTSGQADVTLPPTPRDVAYAVRRIRSCDDEAAAQVALEHFADGHARAAVLAARQQRAGGVSPTLLASTHKGMRVDYRGLLHQARADLGRNSALAKMLRQLQVHLRELGQRWYTADTAVVDELLQLYCIESEARAALLARAGENNG